MAISKQDVMGMVKQLLKIDIVNIDHEDLIDLYTSSMERHILNDINHQSMPDGLLYAWAHMTAGALTSEQSAVLFPPDPDAEAFEVKLGDTMVKPIKSVAQTTGPAITIVKHLLFDYRIDLNRYRRLGW